MIFEPAFPDAGRPGMCLRDYIAIKAMAALLRSESPGLSDFDAVAADAYRAADALLEARKPATPDWTRQDDRRAPLDGIPAGPDGPSSRTVGESLWRNGFREDPVSAVPFGAVDGP